MLPLSRLRSLPVVLTSVAILSIVVSIFFYNRYQTVQNRLKKIESSTPPDETKNYLAKIGQFIELPSGEEPTTATIKDKDKLKDQAFFNRAENGDVVFIYVQAKKAILYRPSLNKVIDVAPVNLNSSPSATPKSPKTSPTP